MPEAAPAPSRSLKSCLPVEKSFSPRATTEVKVAVAISRMATALASWSVTMALVPSGEMARYSGSKSVEGTPAPKKRTPAAFSEVMVAVASKALKSAVCTTPGRPAESTAMMLTVPMAASGMVALLPASSPSLQTNNLVPSGVKAMWSGTAPTTAEPISAPVAALRKTTWPLEVVGELMIAAARILGFPPLPLRTVMEETSLLVRPETPNADGAIVVSCTGAAASVRFTTWMPTPDEANARLDAGSKAGISEPPSKMLLLRDDVIVPLAGKETGTLSSLVMVTVPVALPRAAVPVPCTRFERVMITVSFDSITVSPRISRVMF